MRCRFNVRQLIEKGDELWVSSLQELNEIVEKGWRRAFAGRGLRVFKLRMFRKYVQHF